MKSQFSKISLSTQLISKTESDSKKKNISLIRKAIKEDFSSFSFADDIGEF